MAGLGFRHSAGFGKRMEYRNLSTIVRHSSGLIREQYPVW